MRREDARALTFALVGAHDDIASAALSYAPAWEGVAIILWNDKLGNRAYELDSLKREGHRRALATEFVCHLACMAYEEGAAGATARLTPSGLDWRTRAAIDANNAPTYTELRGFLIGELDADPRLAARVAMQRVARDEKFRHRIAEHYRNTGWL